MALHFSVQSVSPNQFLQYDPSTNQYIWTDSPVPLSSGNETTQPPSSSLPSTSPRQGGDLGPGDQAPSPQGSVFGAAAGMNAFATAVDAATVGTPAGMAVAGLSSFGDVRSGFEKAAALEAAQSPNATIADSLRGYQARPSTLERATNIAGTALSAFTGNPIGTIAGLLGIASDFKATQVADEALGRAAEMEQAAARTGKTTSYGFGYANTVSNFQDMQARNLAAAQTEETEITAPATATGTIGQVLGTTAAARLSSTSGSQVSSSGAPAGTSRSGYGVGSSGIAAYGGPTGMSRASDPTGFSGTGASAGGGGGFGGGDPGPSGMGGHSDVGGI